MKINKTNQETATQQYSYSLIVKQLLLGKPLSTEIQKEMAKKVDSHIKTIFEETGGTPLIKAAKNKIESQAYNRNIASLALESKNNIIFNKLIENKDFEINKGTTTPLEIAISSKNTQAIVKIVQHPKFKLNNYDLINTLPKGSINSAKICGWIAAHTKSPEERNEILAYNPKWNRRQMNVISETFTHNLEAQNVDLTTIDFDITKNKGNGKILFKKIKEDISKKKSPQISNL